MALWSVTGLLNETLPELMHVYLLSADLLNKLIADNLARIHTSIFRSAACRIRITYVQARHIKMRRCPIRKGARCVPTIINIKRRREVNTNYSLMPESKQPLREPDSGRSSHRFLPQTNSIIYAKGNLWPVGRHRGQLQRDQRLLEATCT
jgi:hypothetical protein